MPFHHINPDPGSGDDLIPESPFWELEDILIGARHILRRRNADEVRDRAGLIFERIRRYENELVETAEKFGEPFNMYPDDAALLADIIMPSRAFPFRKPGAKEGVSVPLIAEDGWLEAEDFAVLALLKVEYSIDALSDETPEDLLVCAGLLLEAYRCLLRAERARGRDILVPEEYDEFKRRYLDQKKRRISEQNRVAPKSRKAEKLRTAVLEEFHAIRQQFPEKSETKIANEIAERYLDSLPHLTDDDCKLSPDNAKRTIRGWIKQSTSLQANKPQSQPSLQEARKALRKKHSF